MQRLAALRCAGLRGRPGSEGAKVRRAGERGEGGEPGRRGARVLRPCGAWGVGSGEGGGPAAGRLSVGAGAPRSTRGAQPRPGGRRREGRALELRGDRVGRLSGSWGLGEGKRQERG